MNETVSAKDATDPQVHRQRFVILTSVTIALGGFLFGYDTAVISGAILFVRQQFHLTSIETEAAVSIVIAGALLGAAIGGYLGDRFGRRPTMLVIALIYGVFGATTGLANGVTVFVLSRFFVGAAVGVSSMLTPLYIAELAPASSRGALVTLNQMAISTGVVVAYYVDYLFAGSGSWRWMFISAVVPAILLLVGLAYLPETPRWLASQGRFEDGARILAKIESPEEVERDIAGIAANHCDRQPEIARSVSAPIFQTAYRRNRAGDLSANHRREYHRLLRADHLSDGGIHQCVQRDPGDFSDRIRGA